jgi:PAS domain S-box-containing protein
MRGSKYADLIPVFALVFVLGIVFLFDRERASHPEREFAAAETAAERRASTLADVLGNEVSSRLGALAAVKVNFGAVSGPAGEAEFMAALDSVAVRTQGISGISLVYVEDEHIVRAQTTGLGRALTLSDTIVRHAFLRAVGNRVAAATDVIDYGAGRRVLVFDPIARDDTSQVTAVLVAELDPHAIYRPVATGALDTISGPVMTHTLYGPDNVRLSAAQPIPAGWGTVVRDVRVADSVWRIEVAYAPPDLRGYRAERLATWIAGVALAMAVAVILHFLRRTIRTQKDEITRRQAAEEAARTAAEEARHRAIQSRDLAAQLEAAQRQSQRLSTSLDPDDVVEQFLGGVAEILEADVAALYTFEEEGELLVGRRRMVFREIEGITDRLQHEDIGHVRAPVALLPTLGEAVSTGEPYVLATADENGRPVTTRTGGDTAVASVTVPLLIAGHTVGVATWEVYSRPHRFPPALVAFAQALGAPAAAALRTAELFASLEAERRRAAREAVRFGAVLDQMADGVIVVDGAGLLERSNAAAEELLGEDLGSTPVEEWPVRLELVSVEGRPLGASDFPLSRAMRGETVRRATFIVRSGWGGERHLSCSAGPILDQSGTPAGAAMVLRDVTDEHQYAEMLRHTNRELRRQAEVLEQVNQQLREATKAKDQFLAVMSHELRTPINAIMGYSDLLDLGVKGPLNEDQRAMLTRVRETSRHLLGLINEVLDLAKIGAGRMDLIMVELDAGAVVDRAAQQILPLAASKGLTLTVEDPSEEQMPILVHADETRLTQIIVNLLSNAVKFTSSGTVGIAYERDDGEVRIRVSDTGPGIPQEQAERIFEEFYQVEGGLSRASGGTGLGLAIARRFARLMQGDITVSSEVGRGSVFTLRLPTAEMHGEDPSHGADATVLVLARGSMVERLEAELNGGVRLLGAEEPAQLAALARREQPRFIALYADAPDHAAWRTISALLSEPGTAGIPALLFAADPESPERAIDFGLISLLGKPLSIEQATGRVLASFGADARRAVLIADDDPHVRRILGEALAAAGCEVRTAGSGGEALEIARRTRPQVAVIDLLMPGMDGLETIAAIRAEPEFDDLHVLALVSREMPPEEMDRLSAAVAGARRRARARLTPELLLAALEKTGGHRWGVGV